VAGAMRLRHVDGKRIFAASIRIGFRFGPLGGGEHGCPKVEACAPPEVTGPKGHETGGPRHVTPPFFATGARIRGA
jgi:hypothetical protein